MTRVARLVRKLAAARRLSAADWAIVAEALWEIGRADILVSANRYERWRPELEAAPDGNPGPADPRVIAVFETAAGNYVRPVGCLRRSIALRSMLRRRGYAARIRFGVRHDGPPPLDAHAWVDVGGHPAETCPDVRSRYVALERARGEAV